jgi:hypothetical protein
MYAAALDTWGHVIDVSATVSNLNVLLSPQETRVFVGQLAKMSTLEQLDLVTILKKIKVSFKYCKNGRDVFKLFIRSKRTLRMTPALVGSLDENEATTCSNLLFNSVRLLKLIR